MYLNVYVPPLQCEPGVVKFFRSHRGHPFASSALMETMTKSFVAGMERFAKQQQIPVVQFRKGQRKDDIMGEHLARFDKPEGAVLLGKAQEKTPVFPDGKAAQSGNGQELSVDCAVVGNDQSVLLVLSGPGVRPVLSQICLLLPVHRQTLPERARVCQMPASPGRHRIQSTGQRICFLREPRAAADDLRGDGATADRWTAAPLAITPSAPVPGAGPRSRIPLRHFHPAGGILSHTGSGPTAARPHPVRGNHPGEPRYGPARQGATHLQPAGDEANAGTLPDARADRWSQFRHCMSITRTPASSSTSNKSRTSVRWAHGP